MLQSFLCSSYNFIAFPIAPVKSWKVTRAVGPYLLKFFCSLCIFLQPVGKLERRLYYFFIIRICYSSYCLFYNLKRILLHDVTFNVNYHNLIKKFQF